jgi:hypothetical protein
MPSKDVVNEIKKILGDLTPAELKLAYHVIKIEKDNMHIQKPRIKDDMLKVVREVIK